MEAKNILNIKSREEFRNWLLTNSEIEKECWIAVKKGKNIGTDEFSYLDSVEEALCFGWIDTTHKNINGTDMQKFTPRSTKTIWSELNKERCRRLDKLGFMTERGRKVLPNMSIDNFVVDEDIKLAFDNNPIAKENFSKFPSLYQRVRIDCIQRDKKKDKVVFEKRLKKLIEMSELNKMFGEWNDNGKLL